MDENKGKEASHKGLRSFLDNIEGDKVIWIVALLLIVISVLVIFSSTPLMRDTVVSFSSSLSKISSKESTVSP